MSADSISAFDLRAAKTYVTKTDEYILLRLQTSSSAQPETWLRMHRADFIDFAAQMSSDAAQISIDH